MTVPNETITHFVSHANKYTRGLVKKYTQGGLEIHATVATHVIERAIERGIPHSTVAKVLQRLFQTHLCELIFCMETKDLTYLNWKGNIRELVIPCRTRKREDGSYSITFTSIFEGICKIRDEHHNIKMRH